MRSQVLFHNRPQRDTVGCLIGVSFLHKKIFRMGFKEKLCLDSFVGAKSRGIIGQSLLYRVTLLHFCFILWDLQKLFVFHALCMVFCVNQAVVEEPETPSVRLVSHVSLSWPKLGGSQESQAKRLVGPRWGNSVDTSSNG